MSADLLKRRIAARQRNKELEGKTFTLRRPTEFELVKYANSSRLEFLAACIDDVNLTEADVISNGSAEVPVPFDRALVFDWLQEHSEMWKPLSNEVNDMLRVHREAQEEAAKN
ncbi:MAG: hypothetical protein Q8K57_13440 [Thiobacillus sp.]|nr:hypothetical protein [Thiobacillus sp.]MDP1925772.1 hypothetical protein [Thiobacillus sp.]